MLDLPLLERISLVRRPLSQRLMGGLLAVNYHGLPGVAIVPAPLCRVHVPVAG